jgi:NAD-dependent DNA ligase
VRNAMGLKVFKSARNAAAGAMRRLGTARKKTCETSLTT